MKRHLLIILTALVLGLVCNVGVAWWCAITLDVYQAQGQTGYQLDSGHWVKIRRWDSIGATLVATRRLRDLSLRALPSTGGGDADLPDWQLPPLEGDESQAVIDRCADGRGWPYLAMWAEWTILPGTVSAMRRDVRGGIETSFPARNALGQSPVIPLRAIWPGFALNVLIYAAPFWFGLAVPSTIRRAIRRRRGLCVRCGYPRLEPGPCAECGES